MSYKHLKVFVDLCMLFIFGKKWYDCRKRETLCVLGLTNGQNVYKLYNVKSEKNYIHRNMTLVEDVFLFGKNDEMNKI